MFECFASLELYKWQFTLHRPEFGVASAAWRHIRGPRQGVFLHIHCGISGQGAFPVGQRVESEKPAHAQPRLEPLRTFSHMHSIAYDPEGVYRRSVCMFLRNFPAPHGEDVVGSFPPLMLLIKPHAFWSACAHCEVCLWSRWGRERVILY